MEHNGFIEEKEEQVADNIMTMSAAQCKSTMQQSYTHPTENSAAEHTKSQVEFQCDIREHCGKGRKNSSHGIDPGYIIELIPRLLRIIKIQNSGFLSHNVLRTISTTRMFNRSKVNI